MRARTVVLSNAVLTFAILIGINAICWTVLSRVREPDDRANLPNFEDHEYARLMFEESRRSLEVDYKPYIGWSRRPFQGETTVVDEHGDRIHTPPADHDGQAKVVRFFGGSTMWGSGADDGGTIPALFNHLHPEFRVHNHAESGFNSRQCLDRLINIVTLDQPVDIVIFYNGVNDVLHLCRSEIDVPGHSMVQVIDRAVKGQKDEKIIGEFFRVIMVKYTMQLLAKVKERLAPPAARESGYDCAENEDKVTRIVRSLVHNLEIAHDLVSERGGVFLALLEPVVFAGSPRRDHLKLDPDQEEIFRVVYPRIQQEMRVRNHDWYHDLTGVYDRGDEFVYVDFCHVSKNGNQAVAERIGELLVNTSRQRAASAPKSPRQP